MEFKMVFDANGAAPKSAAEFKGGVAPARKPARVARMPPMAWQPERLLCKRFNLARLLPLPTGAPRSACPALADGYHRSVTAIVCVCVCVCVRVCVCLRVCVERARESKNDNALGS